MISPFELLNKRVEDKYRRVPGVTFSFLFRAEALQSSIIETAIDICLQLHRRTQTIMASSGGDDSQSNLLKPICAIRTKGLADIDFLQTQLTTTDNLEHATPLKESSAELDQGGVVIGLYGIQGCGKTHMMNRMRNSEGDSMLFYDGSDAIEHAVPGGLAAFKTMEKVDQTIWRKCAIEKIRESSVEAKIPAVVAGHSMFWTTDDKAEFVHTESDWSTYTMILYLDVPADVIHERRTNDMSRERLDLTIESLEKWQEAEIQYLRTECLKRGILFMVMRDDHDDDYIGNMLNDLTLYIDEDENLRSAEEELRAIIYPGSPEFKTSWTPPGLNTLLMIDADKTLTVEDTGKLLWNLAPPSRITKHNKNPLKNLFDAWGYSYNAFRQAMLMLEESFTETGLFDQTCQAVADDVQVHSEFIDLLKEAEKEENVRAVVVTCGMASVWEIILEREGLHSTRVIGMPDCISSPVITSAVKRDLVSYAQDIHKLKVWAFGDSPLDLPMMRQAEHAVVVVGSEDKRSKSMDKELSNAIDSHGLKAHQVLLPSNLSPRLDTSKLPVVDITSSSFLNSIMYGQLKDSIKVIHGTETNASKLLMTPTRDASNFGPPLREAHGRVAWHLATQYLGEVIGLEEYNILHV